MTSLVHAPSTGERASSQRLERAAALVGVLLVVASMTTSLLVAHAFWTLTFLPYAVMGFLIIWQQPRNIVGWGMLATGLAFAVQGVFEAVDKSVIAHLPVGVEAALLPVQAVPFTLLIAVVLLFPTGTIESRLQAGALILCGILTVAVTLGFLLDADSMWSGRTNPLAFSWAQGFSRPLTAGAAFATVPALITLGLASLIIRWRRSAGAVRQQYRWLGLGVLATLVGFFVLFVTNFSTIGLFIGPLLLMCLPISMGIAVTRHGLFELNRIISRTLSYAVVTGMLLAVYGTIVVSVGRLLGTKSPIVVAAATLAVAALARPLLRRVQRVVDRRFDRARYDGIRTVERFGGTLQHTMATAEAERQLLAAVETTLQPASATLWLREVSG